MAERLNVFENLTSQINKIPPFTYLQGLKERWNRLPTFLKDSAIFIGSLYGIGVLSLGFISAVNFSPTAAIAEVVGIGFLGMKAGQKFQKYTK